MATRIAISRTGAFLIALLAAAPLASQAPSPSAVVPFALGETLAYDVTWSVFPAGQVNVILKRAEGRTPEVYEVVTTARSQGFVSLLYNVQNEFHSYFDPATACALEIRKNINEGRRHKKTQIVFDKGLKLAILDEVDSTKPGAPAKHAENDIPACVVDVVTAFYHVRRHSFRVGEPILVPINDGAKTYEVTVEVQAREPIQTPLGLRNAFRVEPKVFGGLYKRKGRMLIWFSDDEQRLPLRIQASLTMGTLTGTLKSVTNNADAASPLP